MANRILRPFINPLTFYVVGYSQDPRFNTKDFEDFEFSDTILPWEQAVCWSQPFQLGDVIHDQLQTNYGPVTLKMYRESDDALIDTIPYSQIVQNYNDPDMYVYEVDVDLSGYDEGRYYFTVSFGNPVTVVLRTGIVDIRTIHENSILMECKHFEYREDMIFETGIQPGIRFYGTKKFKGPASKNTLYDDQVLNTQILRSINFRIWSLVIGGTFGIPDEQADKMDRMLGCSTVLIDGKYMVKQDASLEPTEQENYPLRGWRIDMREKTNRAGRHLVDSTPQNTTVSVMVNVDSKGFGDDNGGSEQVILDIE